MSRVVILPLPEGITRMESGPMQFEDDWPGLFMRGDDAVLMGMYVRQASQILRETDPIASVILERVADTLESCRAN